MKNSKQEKALPNRCPRCGRMKLEDIEKLSRTERIAAEAKAAGKGFTETELRKARYCTSCGDLAPAHGRHTA